MGGAYLLDELCDIVKFVFSGNLPEWCVLIELLYCGLIKFFFVTVR